VREDVTLLPMREEIHIAFWPVPWRVPRQIED